MSPVRKIGKNLVFKTLTELIGRALSFVFYIALARWLGEVAFGAFSLLYSVTAVVVFLVDPGLNTLLIRQTPRDPDFLHESAGAILGLKLVLTVFTVAFASAYGVMAGYDYVMVGLLGLMGAQMAGFALTEYASAIFQSMERMQMETLLMGVSKISVTGCAIAALWLGAGLEITLIVMTCSQVAMTVWALAWTAGKGAPLSPRLDVAAWKGLLKRSAPLAAITFFTIAYYRADVAMAPFLGLSLQKIGWYSAGIKILDVVLAIPTLFMASAFPTLSGKAKSCYPDFRKWMNMALGFLGVSGIMVGGSIAFFSPEIVATLFGQRFSPASGPLLWLGVAACAIFIRHGLVYALIIDGKFRTAAIIVAWALPLNVTMNLVLIPLYGLNGAAVAKCLTDTAIVISATMAWIKTGAVNNR